MEKWLTNSILNDRDHITEMWLEEVKPYKVKENTAHISDGLFETVNTEFVNIMILSAGNDHSATNLEEFIQKLIELGWPLAYFTDCLYDFRRVLLDLYLSEKEKIDADYTSRLIKSVDNWIEPIIHKLVSGYSGSWE